ncbi:MAG: hypothetical protein COV76_05005 [Candidatus Omnitrophica bacterium CG11_big_fil_rev_8_21_14_0_20_64_10]|nr:MAG: hypothetical protein COV76_05005 [Candidatus Omnitrophica bacterium CG11_big_fil_rev_8_21_14_0_20_64_10]
MRFLAGLLLALVCLSFAPPAGADQIRIVAVVNDEVITQAELDRALAPLYMQLHASEADPEKIHQETERLRRFVLDQLIQERLLLQEARNPSPIEFGKGKIGTPEPVTVSTEEVDEALAEMRGQFSDPQQFQQGLAQQGMTLDDLRSRLRDQLTIDKLIGRQVRSRVSVSPSEITAIYEQHRDQFVVPQAIEVSTILIRSKDTLDQFRAKALAEDLRNRILQGEDFAELARRFSDGPSAPQGGRAGLVEKGKVVPEIEEVLFSLQAGEISPVIKTETGYHIFRADSIRPSRQAPLEEVQGIIRNRLYREKTAQRLQSWIQELKADAYISIK